MKRIVVLIDGTWNKEGTGADTNVAKLDSGKKIITQAFIKAFASDGTEQHVHYHDGVGAEGDFLQKLLGGALGLGLKKIIQDVYEVLVSDYAVGDEIYIFGFSRGAYAADAPGRAFGPCFRRSRQKPSRACSRGGKAFRLPSALSSPICAKKSKVQILRAHVA